MSLKVGSHGHDAAEVKVEVVIQKWCNPLDDGLHITIGCCVDATKKPHHQTHVHFEVEEAGKECSGFVIIEL